MYGKPCPQKDDAAEPSIPAMERTIDGFRGFLDCLEEAREKGLSMEPGYGKSER